MFFSCLMTAQDVSLNEVMASNSSVIADEDGDYEDWIEIYNYGDDEVNLEGFYLSDDYSVPYMWEFPETIILPGEYLLVWASGKDRNNPHAPLHTNFRISRAGEEIIFTSSGGKRIDELAPTPIPTDKVYGRNPDGTGSWHYPEYPTPGLSNASHIHGKSMLLHYWFFNTDIPNNTPLVGMEAFYGIMPGGEIEYISCLTGYPFYENHYNWRKASMERRNMPTPVNYRPEGNDNICYANTDMRGLQVKQPFESNGLKNTIIFHLPSTGFENMNFRFAAKDEGAAEYLIIDYSVNDTHEKWTVEGLINTELELSNDYQLYEVDFQNIDLVDNNPDFKIRIRFGGENMSHDNGNRVTFNNITLDGEPLKAYYIHSSAGKNGMIYPFGFNKVFKGKNKTFNIFPETNFIIDRVEVDGIDVSEQVYTGEDETGIYEFENVAGDHVIQTFFLLNPEYLKQQKDKILIYPNPATITARIKSAEKFHKIVVINLKGDIIYENITGSYDYSLNISGFAPGMYIINIHLSKKIVSRKFQVIKP